MWKKYLAGFFICRLNRCVCMKYARASIFAKKCGQFISSLEWFKEFSLKNFHESFSKNPWLGVLRSSSWHFRCSERCRRLSSSSSIWLSNPLLSYSSNSREGQPSRDLPRSTVRIRLEIIHINSICCRFTFPSAKWPPFASASSFSK